MKIRSAERAALDGAVCDGRDLRLPAQLGVEQYARVNRLLVAAGGRYVPGRGAHVFEREAAAVLTELLAAGEVKTIRERTVERQMFPTPTPLVERLIDLAQVRAGQAVLEPSAGDGAIAERLAARGAIVDCIELDADSAARIRAGEYARSVVTGDFLKRPRRPVYDAVVMNPPFAGRQDLRHVEHAEGFVRPGGALVAVMGNGITGDSPRLVRFRQRVERLGGEFQHLPADAFRESGARARTVAVRIPVPVELNAPPPPRMPEVPKWQGLTPKDFGRPERPHQDGLFLLGDADELGTPPFDALGFGVPLHQAVAQR
ncbi:hypothetical protein ACFYUY_04330 [Kitasatospora sp. NPDC004745]|uniref:hypothetical protein n=1 Tax=Kitasatospora sp. NPDC004745 TaxID=3364019 RepID=UPI0036C9BD36